MLDILSQHLTQNCTPELYASIAAAHQTFERIGLENYESGFEELLMTDDLDAVKGASSTTEAVVRLTEELLRKILADHAVTCTEEVSCEQLNDLVNALLDLQDYSDLATLEATASLEGEPGEVLAELVALVTPHAVSEVMLWLQDVSYFLPKRIRELARRGQSEAVSSDTFARLQECRGRLAKALNCGAISSELDILRAIREGLSLGLPFAVYVRMLGERFGNYTPERTAEELLAMAYASADAGGNPRGMIQQHIELYVTNMDALMAVDVQLTARLLKINQS